MSNFVCDMDINRRSLLLLLKCFADSSAWSICVCTCQQNTGNALCWRKGKGQEFYVIQVERLTSAREKMMVASMKLYFSYRFMKPCACVTNLQVYLFINVQKLFWKYKTDTNMNYLSSYAVNLFTLKSAPLYERPMVQLIAHKFLIGLGHSNVLKFKSFILILDFRLDCFHSFVYMYFSFINILYVCEWSGKYQFHF